MKLTAFLFTAALMHAFASGSAQNVTLTGKNIKLRQVFNAIEEQTGYVVFANKSNLLNMTAVSLDARDMPLRQLLEEVLKAHAIKYIIKDKTIVLFEDKPIPALDFYTYVPVAGQVRGMDGQPLAGVNIIVKGSGKGASTSSKGEFSLQVNDGDVLEISAVGFVPLALRLSGNTFQVISPADGKPESVLLDGSAASLQVRLAVSTSPLDEVQIVAYGTNSRRLQVGNVGTIKAEEIGKQTINNPILALQGRIPGVEILQTKGIPGSEVTIRIRGVNSMDQNKAPLFIVDGVPFNSTIEGFGGLSSYNASTPLSWINPADIESIDVLKDAVATSMYGSRAANGVVLITTKKGKPGRTAVDVNIQHGFSQTTRKAKLLNTQQYLEMRREAFANDGVTPTEEEAPDLLKWDPNAYTDWQKVLTGGTAQQSNVQASISGGNANTQFRIAGGYSRETTVFPGDWSNRKASLQFNINNVSQNQRFKVMLSGSYLADNNQLPMTDFAQYITLAPNAPPLLYPDGSLNWDDYWENPFRALKTRYIGKSSNLVGNGMLSYELLPGLEIKTTLGYNTIVLNERNMTPRSAIAPREADQKGSASFNSSILKTWLIEPQVSYNHRLGRGLLNLMAGGAIQRRGIEGQHVSGNGYTDDNFLSSLAGAANIFKGESIFEEHRFASVFARLNYNWAEKFLLEASARRDGSSRFGPGRQFGNFGATGLGWIFSQENFIRQAIPFLSHGKLRISYGSSGNEPAQNYRFMELFYPSAQPYGGSLSFRARSVAVADFQWEVNRKFETGLEAGVLQDRILLSASFFRNRSSNQIVGLPLPPMVGFLTATSNLPALIQNTGWEFTLNTVNIRKRDFQWNSGLNVTVSRNKLVSFPNFEKSPYRWLYQVGEPLNIHKLLRFAGINPNTGLYEFYDRNGNVTANPTYEDQVFMRSRFPKFYGGMQHQFTYKNLRLDVNFHFISQKGENYLFANSNPPGYASRYDASSNQPSYVMDRVKGAAGNGLFQRFSASSDAALAYNNARGSTLAFTDASFIRLENVSLSYQLRETLLQRIKAHGIRVYAQAQNLLVITGYKGSDPEIQNIRSLAPLCTIVGGIQLTL